MFTIILYFHAGRISGRPSSTVFRRIEKIIQFTIAAICFLLPLYVCFVPVFVALGNFVDISDAFFYLERLVGCSQSAQHRDIFFHRASLPAI